MTIPSLPQSSTLTPSPLSVSTTSIISTPLFVDNLADAPQVDDTLPESAITIQSGEEEQHLVEDPDLPGPPSLVNASPMASTSSLVAIVINNPPESIITGGEEDDVLQDTVESELSQLTDSASHGNSDEDEDTNSDEGSNVSSNGDERSKKGSNENSNSSSQIEDSAQEDHPESVSQ